MRAREASASPPASPRLTPVRSAEASARKGRSKKEASDNTNRPSPSGHERKLVEKLQNSEKKSKE